MSKAPKIVQLIPAPPDLNIVRGETAKTPPRNRVRVVDPLAALALLEDGSIRAVFVEHLKDDNIGVVKVGSSDALLTWSRS